MGYDLNILDYIIIVSAMGIATFCLVDIMLLRLVG